MNNVYSWPENYGDPSWFLYDRFGLFIHWGLYSLKAKDEWIMTQEKIPKENYENYLSQFSADLYDARSIVKKAKECGMKYIVLTTKHHEGFALWDSKYTDYKITNSPHQKDVLKEFVDACREENVKIGFYHSLIDWHHEHFTIDGLHPQRDEERVKQEKRNMAVYQQYLHNQVEELVTSYGKIDYFWFDFSYDDRDWGWSKGKGAEDWLGEELEALILKNQPHILLNNRLGLNRGVYTPEQYQPTSPLYDASGNKMIWEACQTFNERWTYNPNNLHHKSPEMILKLLIDTVAKDGNFLMNFGLTARGDFDKLSSSVMDKIAEWMKYHKQSIHGAGASELSPPQDCRITQKGDTIYLHLFSWPFRTVHLKDFGREVEYARFLHDHSEVSVKVFEESEIFHHDVPVIEKDETVLELPVIKPDLLVPVIEMKLKN
ncbi:alpha-L-fucosidase [Alkalihalophilus lindianensis]|uniref:alpha-L-fucosidase n=1 Tax=Alkalihalophilus lindianensis TaxID=1630542 RepID=A0ABU3X8R9_9BACI|nr:alpha-L-fucosidase [Alkalihalophilus lindianensis]MDV2684264.1 alpha-L-fucosidase [Alkalihalophilus lindianensis]